MATKSFISKFSAIGEFNFNPLSFNMPSSTKSVEVYLNGIRTKIFSSQKNVNPDEWEKNWGSICSSSQKHGPFPVNGSITIQGEKIYSWGEIKS